MPKPKSSCVNCSQHGQQVAAVVCCHMIDASDSVGFVENSVDPEDLQAWCEKCEQFFLAEGEMTDAFMAFNDFAVVCNDCYQALKKHHTRRRKSKTKNAPRKI